jgi:pyruvate dehydrogenase E2 component (dihydrolipoamide acetyltransferase)
MPAEITMPQLSDTMSEGTVVKWLKKEGDKVREGEKIAEVETDKAVMEMEAFEGGTLAVVLAKEGEKVAVGAAIAVLASSKENPAEVKQRYGGAGAAVPAAAAAPKPAAARQEDSSSMAPEAPGGGVATIEAASQGELHESANVGHGATREKPTAVPPMPGRNGNGHGGGVAGRTFVSPLARRIATDKGLDLSSLTGSGPGGRIIQRDVLAAVERALSQPFPEPAGDSSTGEGAARQPAAPATPTAPQPSRVSRGEKQVLPLSKMRQAIAKGLQASKQNVPHFYLSVEVDVEELSILRGRLNDALEKEKVRLSIGDLISKAVAVALLKHPALNAHYNGEKADITRFGDVHLGFAVALPEGLIVPVLRNIDQMGLKEIRTRSADLIDRARAQRLKQDEMTGATFTISNLGTFGVSEFSAIVNPPAVGILAVASAQKKPVVRGDAVVVRTMLNLTLSADHRAVDGATAADFMRTLKGLLEEPGLMLV